MTVADTWHEIRVFGLGDEDGAGQIPEGQDRGARLPATLSSTDSRIRMGMASSCSRKCPRTPFCLW